MSKTAYISWDADPDSSRRYWRIYQSDDAKEKGDLLAEVNPNQHQYATPIDEGEWIFRVLSVSLKGVEEDWQNTSGRASVIVTGEEHKPSAMTASGGARVAAGQMWGVDIQPPPSGDPRQRIQLIRGGEFTGQEVGQVHIPFNREQDECGMRYSAPVGMAPPGRGATVGGSETFAIRGVSEDGSTPGTALTFSLQHLDLPNHKATVLASVVGATLTNFSAATSTDRFEYVAGVGCRLRELPTVATATTANGWGTVASGIVSEEPYGAYYVTGATVRSQELDMGDSLPFILECYDEFQRTTMTGTFATLRIGDNPYPAVPQAADGWNGKDPGPPWAHRQARTDGKLLRPVRRVRWQWRAGDSSPVTGLAWQAYPGPVFVKAQYVQIRFRVAEPMGTHQLASERIYVRAWQPCNTRIVIKAGSNFDATDLADVNTAPVREIGIRTDIPNIQVRIGAIVYATATLASVP